VSTIKPCSGFPVLLPFVNDCLSMNKWLTDWYKAGFMTAAVDFKIICICISNIYLAKIAGKKGLMIRKYEKMR
jgi:hypothetical protein